jgi:hypothetical protein
MLSIFTSCRNKSSILKNQEHQNMTQANDDIYRQYGEEFRRKALDFHIPIAQWHRQEVQYFVNFVNCVHQMHEDMLTALDDAVFYPDDEDNADTEDIEGVDDTHRLPNLDGVFKAIRASEPLLQAVELILRSGFDGDLMENLMTIQAYLHATAKLVVLPRNHSEFSRG